MFHPSDPPPVPQGRPSSAAVSYHVGLDTMMGRRSRHRPEEVAIDGFLLLDTGEYELVTARPARRLLEDEGPRHPRTGPHREPGSGRTTLPRIPRSAVSGWSMATSSCPRPGRPTAKQTRRRPVPTVAAELLPLADEVLAREPDGRRIGHGRSGRASLPAAGSRGLFARSGRHRTEGSPVHRDLARAGHASGVPGRLSLDEAQQKARLVAGLLCLRQTAVRAFPPNRRLRAALPRGSCRTSSE